MNRSVLKTIGGLIAIGAIIVATFLYGNANRQADQRKAEEAQRQEQLAANQQPSQAQASATPSASPSATPKPTATPTPTATPEPQPATIPATGPVSDAMALIAVTILGTTFYAYRRSRTAVIDAARTLR